MKYAFLALAAVLTALAVWAGDAETAAPPGLALWETAVSKKVESTPELMSLGKKIYAQRCALCHGKSGAGDGAASLLLDVAPRNFTTAVYKFKTTTPAQALASDRDIFRSITTGFPAHGMPAFSYLTATQRWALVHHVQKLTRDGLVASLKAIAEENDDDYDPAEAEEILKPAPEIEIPSEPKDVDLARGKALYVEQCAKCHGDTGKGDGPSVNEELKDNWGHIVRPRNMAAGRAYRKAGWRARDTVRMILLGIPGTPMPVIEIDVKTPEGRRDIWSLARFVETLEKKR